MYFISKQPNFSVLAIVFGCIAIVALLKRGSVLLFLTVLAVFGLICTSIRP